jgi:hypothetical protein
VVVVSEKGDVFWGLCKALVTWTVIVFVLVLTMIGVSASLPGEDFSAQYGVYCEYESLRRGSGVAQVVVGEEELLLLSPRVLSLVEVVPATSGAVVLRGESRFVAEVFYDLNEEVLLIELEREKGR